ncbi:CDP-alcohol phosphatidyltransferase family protein, partial [Nonomuraea dietziae]|uniref:CDP-alcohol phosphatidyltransferase family protein n=1 Tax=Nonomuraea dietziae TaxID=65515 RepID=UPI0031D6C206
MVAGGVLIYFAFVFDCVDGQVARYARKFGVLGAWLDATFDRFKEYVVFAGLAIGYVVAGHSDDIWILALAALALQSVKHLLDFSFGAANRRKPPSPLPTTPLTAPDDRDLRKALERRKVERSSGHPRRAEDVEQGGQVPRRLLGAQDGRLPHRRAVRGHRDHRRPLRPPGSPSSPC